MDNLTGDICARLAGTVDVVSCSCHNVNNLCAQSILQTIILHLKETLSLMHMIISPLSPFVGLTE